MHTHILKPVPLETSRPKLFLGDERKGLEKYLADESRRSGQATALAFPSSVEEVAGAVQEAAAHNWDLTISAARTGIAAGAVPADGLLLSLEKLNQMRGLRISDDGDLLLRCQAGVLLAEVQKAVQSLDFPDISTWDAESKQALQTFKGKKLFYPPDPTETSAAIGGTIACNASGAHTFLYGPTRPYVHSLSVVLMDGRLLEIERGQYHADADGTFGIEQEDKTVRYGKIPSYAWPKTKNSAGYFSGEKMDLIDLFIGSEGTLGIIVEAEVRAIPAAETNCALMTFWGTEATAVQFTRTLRGRRAELGVEAIEYVDPNAMNMLRERRNRLGAASGVPECLPATAACSIYLDLGVATDDLPAILEELAETITASGGNPEECWTALARDERERLRVFRHALPETVNAYIAEIRKTHAGITKLGTDMAVPDEHLEHILKTYRTHLDKAGLNYVIFGHIGNNHVHVNILPTCPEDYAKGWELYHQFSEIVVSLGGSPAAEHGIGKLKTDFMETLHGSRGVEEMRAIKKLFDPEEHLGPGTLFPRSDAS